MLVDDIRYEHHSIDIDDQFKDDLVRDAQGYCCSEQFCFLTGMYVVAIKDSPYGEIRTSRMLSVGCLFCGAEIDMPTGKWIRKDPSRLPLP